MSPHIHLKTGVRAGVGGRFAKLLGFGFIASVLAAPVLGGGVVQAASIADGGDYRTGSGLRCTNGQVGANLPVVAADTSGIAWQITEVLRYDGTTFGSAAWSDYRWASIGAGSTNQGIWTGYRSGQPEPLDSFTVAPGTYYALRQWAYVDGSWIALLPSTAGPGGSGVYQVCFA